MFWAGRVGLGMNLLWTWQPTSGSGTNMVGAAFSMFSFIKHDQTIQFQFQGISGVNTAVNLDLQPNQQC
jgi:hypothetical protein